MSIPFTCDVSPGVDRVGPGVKRDLRAAECELRAAWAELVDSLPRQVLSSASRDVVSRAARYIEAFRPMFEHLSLGWDALDAVDLVEGKRRPDAEKMFRAIEAEFAELAREFLSVLPDDVRARVMGTVPAAFGERVARAFLPFCVRLAFIRDVEQTIRRRTCVSGGELN